MRKSVIWGCADLWGTCMSFLPVTARFVEDETRNGNRNANRNHHRNQETTVLWLFSNFQVRRDLEQ